MFYTERRMDEFTQAHRAELLRVVDGLRGAIEASVSLSAPLDELRALADQAHALARSLKARSGQKPIPRYGPPFDPNDPNAMIAYSPITGPYSPLAPPVKLSVEPGESGEATRVVGAIAFGEAYEGPPSSVHGSIIASVYDQLLALAAIAADCGGPTATLSVQFRRMTPLRTPLRFEAWVDRIDGRKAFVRGACRAVAGGELLSESEGMFVRFRGA
jgi:acyl-coenzyme A thioesterase PaaI-like protein